MKEPRRIRIYDGANWFTGKCNLCSGQVKFKVTKMETSMYCVKEKEWLWDEYTLINEKTGQEINMQVSPKIYHTRKMKFLLYKGGRIGLNYGHIHQLTTPQIVSLRNQLKDIRKLRELDLEMSIEWAISDFRTVWINPPIESELIEALNSMILNRRTKDKEK